MTTVLVSHLLKKMSELSFVGIALLLEIFRVLASEHFLPNRSIEFHFYSAEEEGLYGR